MKAVAEIIIDTNSTQKAQDRVFEFYKIRLKDLVIQSGPDYAEHELAEP